MNKINAKEFGTYFFLEFTRELIKNSADTDLYKLVRLVDQKEEKIKEQEINEKKSIRNLVKEKVEQNERYDYSIKSEKNESFSKEKNPFATIYSRGIIKKDIPGRTLFIPEPALPERLQYLKPAATPNQVDLEKINTLVQDPVVRVIECHGPDKEIIISGNMGTKETNIVLTEEEIERIIKKFSEETRIPLHEGFFKAALGKMIISAIYSESIGSKFIIKKIPSKIKNKQTSFFTKK
jgi:hypothetical protein